MLITFHSAAAADVIMFGDVARTLLGILGKDPADRRGIVTEAQLPEAIARLKAAMSEDRAASRAEPADDEDDDEPASKGMAAPVNLAQRAWPLLDMLEYSLKENCPVTWD